MVTSYAKYPQGSIVWTHDTTLTASFEVPKNKSLYIEPGVTVTANSASDPKVEIVVLGNLYCMGAKAKPVTFTSDSKKPESWGGIICGYDSKEVVPRPCHHCLCGRYSNRIVALIPEQTLQDNYRRRSAGISFLQREWQLRDIKLRVPRLL